MACRVPEPDDWCHACGCPGRVRGSVCSVGMAAHGFTRAVAALPVHRLRPGLASRPDSAAEPRSKLSRAALRWALEGLVIQHLSMTRIAHGLDVAWNTANDAVLAEGQRMLINNPARFDVVQMIGADEHAWRIPAAMTNMSPWSST